MKTLKHIGVGLFCLTFCGLIAAAFRPYHASVAMRIIAPPKIDIESELRSFLSEHDLRASVSAINASGQFQITVSDLDNHAAATRVNAVALILQREMTHISQGKIMQIWSHADPPALHLEKELFQRTFL